MEIIELGRYLGMDGQMGTVPDWYGIICAADRYHCPPWELLEQSVVWRDWAFKATKAENNGRRIKAQHGG